MYLEEIQLTRSAFPKAFKNFLFSSVDLKLISPESTTDISRVKRQKEAVTKTMSIPETIQLESVRRFARCFGKR